VDSKIVNETILLNNIRSALLNNSLVIPDTLSFKFDSSKTQIYITLFQEGNKSIRWGSKKTTLHGTINRIVEKLKKFNTFKNFDIKDSNKCRILFEIIIDEKSCNIRNLTGMSFVHNRFEPGVTGFKYIYDGVTRFFMPTDSITHSIMSVKQLLNFMSKKCGISKKTDKISERTYLMRRESIEYTMIKSKAFITYKDRAIELIRGIPSPIEFNKDTMVDSLRQSIDWLVDNMNNDGSFLYFYDGVSNTKVDLDHPKMIDPLYNNILRHCGGTITLLRGYEIFKDKKYLISAKESIDFFLTTFRKHKYKKEMACYPFFNKKSKLGGAGVGLVSLMQYYINSGDNSYRKEIDGLVRHILSRVDKDGEMIGYYIHPRFNNGKAIRNPSLEMKKELFSFYYPGEALLGLGLYYNHMKDIDSVLRQDVYEKSIKALDFLVDIRPKRYDYMFTSLPADAWLMQAIEEWVSVKGFNKKSYIDFVYNDVKQMSNQMYTEDNTTEDTKDYIGGFFYNYGDHVLHDGSRNEGVIAAYYLAKKLKDEDIAEMIMKNMLSSAKGLMYTFNTPESCYGHKYPEKSIGSFRFKLTRQWVRVDSVQHTACFFARLYKTNFGNSKKVDNEK
jgi:hypothetical protein